MFGSFTAPVVALKKKKIKIDPLINQLYQSLGVGITCQLVNIWAKFNYHPLVLISSFLYCLINSIAQYIIKLIGISVSVSIIGAMTIISSFLWGILLFPSINKVTNILFNVISLILLILGIILMGFCKIIILIKKNGKYSITLKNVNTVQNIELQNKENKNLIKSILLSIFVGILNGSSLIPIQYIALKDNINMITLISFFGIGVLFFTILINIIYLSINYIKHKKIIEYYFKEIFLQIFSAGVIWNIGFICTIYSTNILGLSISFPLSQLSLIVNGFWGIVIFKEIKDKFNIFLWILSTLIILGGAILYSFSIN
jgi:glucose uptake protein GlcU